MLFALMLVFIVLTFGKVFYLASNALPLFFVCLFFLGLGGATNFSVYTLWLPEQYPTGMSRQRFRLLHVLRPLHRRRNHVLGRGLRPPLRLDQARP